MLKKRTQELKKIIVLKRRKKYPININPAINFFEVQSIFIIDEHIKRLIKGSLVFLNEY